ncbi:MAG: branched-chain amino acid ABC transporter substrate-binding protein [Anaerolineae bacterium]|jgi:branched-chain amino acid transport system substrate-binding protein|nr:branched-chain amino acid ABC transporter substrate-binding protein [Anaerolineae bacterium]MDX9832875.1 branched-chain amino acid ABC transporter substrate-binding protein [Anaerolineae bacterium]
MSRKVGFLLALVVLMVPLIAGCGGDTGTIKIGLQGPMTGDYAYEGQGFEKAVGMLVEQVNAAGGIDGREVELLVEDDAGDPTQAALVAQRLVDAKVVAVIGAYNSTATEPASEIYNDAGILHITPSSTATGLTEKGFERFFRVCFLDDRQGLFAAKFAKEILGVQNFGVLHDNSTYAQGLAEHTRRYAEELGMNVTFYDAINPDDQDFTPILTNIGGAGLDAIYFSGYHAQGGLLLKQAGELGLDLQWMMGNASNNPELVQIAGVENAVGTYVTTEPLPKDVDYPEARQFVADFEAKYNEPPASVWWMMSAEAFNVIRYAMEQTESTDPATLAEFLHNEAKDINGITGPVLGWDEKGDRLGTIHVAYRIDETGALIVNPEQPQP